MKLAPAHIKSHVLVVLQALVLGSDVPDVSFVCNSE